MDIFRWDTEKNKKLQLERGLSFEEILYSMETDGLLDIVVHPDQKKYPKQYLLIVKIENYVVVVAAVREDSSFFLKTAFPSRKMTKHYLKGALP